MKPITFGDDAHGKQFKNMNKTDISWFTLGVLWTVMKDAFLFVIQIVVHSFMSVRCVCVIIWYDVVGELRIEYLMQSQIENRKETFFNLINSNAAVAMSCAVHYIFHFSSSSELSHIFLALLYQYDVRFELLFINPCRSDTFRRLQCYDDTKVMKRITSILYTFVILIHNKMCVVSV